MAEEDTLEEEKEKEEVAAREEEEVEEAGRSGNGRTKSGARSGKNRTSNLMTEECERLVISDWMHGGQVFCLC